jgi:hypothetical protein
MLDNSYMAHHPDAARAKELTPSLLVCDNSMFFFGQSFFYDGDGSQVFVLCLKVR